MNYTVLSRQAIFVTSLIEAMDSITSCVKVCPIPAEPINTVGFIACVKTEVK